MKKNGPTIPPKLIFITSGEWNGNLGGVAGADTKCQTAANNAGKTGTFKAWISSTTASAASRMTPYAGPYALTDGTIIANNWADLIDGSNFNLQKETGGTIATAVWTNATTTGGIKTTTSNSLCTNWSNGTSNRAAPIGHSAIHWSDAGTTQTCDQLNSLICVQQ